MSDKNVSLKLVRLKLAKIWFPSCGFICAILIIQSLFGTYGVDVQRVWGWALPNFLPTLGLMVSVFAAGALQNIEADKIFVKKNFSGLAIGLSIFYLMLLVISIVSTPLVNFVIAGPFVEATKIMETSNLWLGPIQGLVAVVLGVLFFSKAGDNHVENE